MIGQNGHKTQYLIFKHKLTETMLGILRFLGLAPAAAPAAAAPAAAAPPVCDLRVDVYVIDKPEPPPEPPAKRARFALACAACARPMSIQSCPRGCTAPDGRLYCAPECIPPGQLVASVHKCMQEIHRLRIQLSQAERELAQARQPAKREEGPLEQREFADLQ